MKKYWSSRFTRKFSLHTIWQQRFKSIQDLEEHLARNGTVIVKFWLNVSKEEQKARFMSRLNVPEKQWKFNAGDVNERKFWDRYMDAYEEALNATSRPWAPWYAVPADNKRYARACVAEIVVEALDSIGLEYPRPTAEDRATFDSAREELSKKW
jgi:polyphosphate kinase 2 (PPK2 family)